MIKIQKSVAAGIQGGINSLMQYLATWDVYKEIWEVDKTKFIQNYKSLNPTSVTFDSDVFRLLVLFSDYLKEIKLFCVNCIWLSLAHYYFLHRLHGKE